MVENYECVYNDLLAGRGMFLCPMKYPAFPAAWYLPLQLPLPDTCLLTLRDDPRPEIQRLREVFTLHSERLPHRTAAGAVVAVAAACALAHNADLGPSVRQQTLNRCLAAHQDSISPSRMTGTV